MQRYKECKSCNQHPGLISVILVVTLVWRFTSWRVTAMVAGDSLITGPGWKGRLPGGKTQSAFLTNAVSVIGRVSAESDRDLSTAHDPAQQMQRKPFRGWQTSQ